MQCRLRVVVKLFLKIYKLKLWRYWIIIDVVDVGNLHVVLIK